MRSRLTNNPAISAPAATAQPTHFLDLEIVFRRGIKGVYFSLITQALLLMTFTLVRAMRPYTGGVDGLTSLASLKLFGYDFEMIAPRRDPNPAMYYMIAGFLAASFLGCALLMAKMRRTTGWPVIRSIRTV